MNERFKTLAVELVRELQITLYGFILKNAKEEENTQDILNLIMSANLSCMFNCMLETAKDLEKGTQEVEKFINDIQEYISKLSIISNVETLTK